MTSLAAIPHASKELTRELWISLASLLRSHVAMHSIARPDNSLRIVPSSDSSVELLGLNGKLILLAPAASGIGSIEFRPEVGELGDEYAVFFFTEDGLFHSDGFDNALDLEAAVEHFIRKVHA